MDKKSPAYRTAHGVITVGLFCWGLYACGYFTPALYPNSDASPTAQVVRLPSDETLFIEAIETTAQDYARQENDFARTVSAKKRYTYMCGELSTNSSPTDWIGTVEQMTTNYEGLGVLRLRIAKSVTVGTAATKGLDGGDGTMIDTDSAVFQQAAQLKVGENVRFSGEWVTAYPGCIRERSFTESDTISAPDFGFRFTKIEAMR